MKHVRIGLVGAGGMGSFHARALASLPGVDVVAVADPFGDSAATLAKELGARASTDPVEVATADVDGIVIASPDETHADLAMTAMNHGTPVLCEKPLATTVADAQRVVDFEVDRGSRLLQLGFMREYDPAHVQVVEALEGFGPVHNIRCVHLNTNEVERPLESIVGQSVVHDLHSVRFMTGAEVTAVHAHASLRPSGGVRHIVATCILDAGAHALVEFDDNGFAYDVVVEVTAETGSVHTGAQLRPAVRTNATSSVEVGRDWFGRFAEAYRIQDQAWVTSLRSGSTSGPSAWDGLMAQTIVEAIVSSINSGSTIALPTTKIPALYSRR